jgi:hypothetical protein
VNHVSLDDWLNDQVPQPRHVSVYREALLMGVTDRRAVANAIAVTEATAKLADTYDSVSFDDIAELMLSQLNGEIENSVQRLTRRWRFRLWRAYVADERAWRWHRVVRWFRRVLTPPGRARIEVDD